MTILSPAKCLAYHSICSNTEDALSVRVEDFQRQLESLKQSDLELTRLGEIFSNPSAKQIALTFDDGIRDYLTNAYPLLERHQIPSVVFLIWDRIGSVQPITHGKYSYLTRGEIQDLAKSGLVEFGSHTLSHRLMHSLNASEVETELRESKDKLEQLLGQTVRYFCYPAGRHHQQVLEATLRAGYQGICLTPRRDQLNWLDPDGRVLLRSGIYRQDSLARFRIKISSPYQLVRKMLYRFATLPTKSPALLEHAGQSPS